MRRLVARLGAAATVALPACRTVADAAQPAERSEPPAPPTASASKATAKWRVFTDVGRDLAREAREDPPPLFAALMLAAGEAG